MDAGNVYRATWHDRRDLDGEAEWSLLIEATPAQAAALAAAFAANPNILDASVVRPSDDDILPYSDFARYNPTIWDSDPGAPVPPGPFPSRYP